MFSHTKMPITAELKLFYGPDLMSLCGICGPLFLIFCFILIHLKNLHTPHRSAHTQIRTFSAFIHSICYFQQWEYVIHYYILHSVNNSIKITTDVCDSHSSDNESVLIFIYVFVVSFHWPKFMQKISRRFRSMFMTLVFFGSTAINGID